MNIRVKLTSFDGRCLMKRIILFIPFFVAFNCFADFDWQSMQEDELYSLDRDLVMSAQIKYTKGDTFGLEKINRIPFLKITEFVMANQQCRSSQLERELEVYEIVTTRETYQLGIEIQKNCLLTFYVENKDLSAISVFGSIE